MKTLERKRQTREKIQLGGLITKAQLHTLSTATLYGLLLEAREKLEGQEGFQLEREWTLQGDMAFTKEKRLEAGED